jgi:hypothetical protein
MFNGKHGKPKLLFHPSVDFYPSACGGDTYGPVCTVGFPISWPVWSSGSLFTVFLVVGPVVGKKT